MDPRHIRPPPMARETPYLPFTLRLKLVQLHRLLLVRSDAEEEDYEDFPLTIWTPNWCMIYSGSMEPLRTTHYARATHNRLAYINSILKIIECNKRKLYVMKCRILHLHATTYFPWHKLLNTR